MFKKIIGISLLISLLQISVGTLMFFNKFEFKEQIPYFKYYVIVGGSIFFLIGAFTLFKSHLISVDIFFTLAILHAIMLVFCAINTLIIITIILGTLSFIAYLIGRIKIQKAIRIK